MSQKYRKFPQIMSLEHKRIMSMNEVPKARRRHRKNSMSKAHTKKDLEWFVNSASLLNFLRVENTKIKLGH